jgi:hypothetical protein
MGNRKKLDQSLALRPFAGARRSDEHDPHAPT